MAQTKKKTSASRKKAKNKPSAAQKKSNMGNRFIWSVVVFAAAILLLCVAIIPSSGVVWKAMQTFVRGIFGWSVFAAPIVCGYIAVLLATDKENSYIAKCATVVLLLMLLAQSVTDSFSVRPDGEKFFEHVASTYKIGIKGGGVFGSVIGTAFNKMLGVPGDRIVLIILTCVVLMLLTGTTIVALFRTFSTPAKKLREAAESAYERRAELQRKHEEELEAAEASKAAAFNSAIDVSVDDGHNPYDIPVEGDPPRQKPSDDPNLLKKQRKKVVNAFNDGLREQSAYNISIDGIPEKAGDSSPSASAEITASDSAATDHASISADIMNAINNSNIDVVSDNIHPDEHSDDEPAPVVKPSKPKSTDEDAAIAAETASDLAAAVEATAKQTRPYRYPPVDLLSKPAEDNTDDIRSEMATNAEKLVNTLRSFGVETRIINISRGPSVTRYELQPAAGVRISRIANLTDDIALALASSGVRIEAPIPNKSAVGIEVPNKVKSSVPIRSLIECDKFRNAKSKITGVLGQDITGENCYVDIAKMPHLLIAGTTGSGKSVCLNSLILSILYKAKPDEVKMVMIDPKAVEMKVYNGIPHLLVPVVTDPRKAAGALGWAVTEMLRRYQLLSESGARNLEGYNKIAEDDPHLEKLPQIVIFIDELADLMMAAPNEVEDSICRLAQMARAAGMHLVIATQSPRTDVITGLIKSNIPSRIALKVSSNIDSRIILDMQGAERLIGYGDMLYSPVGSSKPIRIQGCWVSDSEIADVTGFLKEGEEEKEYDEAVLQEIDRQASLAKQGKKGSSGGFESDSDGGDGYDDADEMLPKAIECILDNGQASTSLLQRKLKTGYARSARIMDQLEERKIVGPSNGSKPREVLITRQQWLEMQATDTGDID